MTSHQCYTRTGASANADGRVRAKGTSAFRLAYIEKFGPLRPDQHVHHRCGNVWCMNLDHAEVMTIDAHSRHHRAERPPPTHCPNGHEYPPDDGRRYETGRRCRICYLASRERGRRRRGVREGHAGEHNGQAKLTWDDVFRIRELHRKGVRQSELAKMFPVSDRSISNIVNHKTWK